MSETMKERIARALCRASAETWRDPPYNNLHTDALNNHWRSKADAVLAAMREPNGAMGLASKRYKRKAKVYSGPGCYRAMIDAAINEGKE